MDEQAAAAQMQQLQRQLQRYDQHLLSLEQSLGELQAAIATLEGIKGDKELDTRVPIGGGVRIKAAIDAAAPVVMDIGAGYATEMSAADALSKLKDRLQSTQSAFTTASQEAEKLGSQMQQMQAGLA